VYIELRFSNFSSKLPSSFLEMFTDNSLERPFHHSWKLFLIIAKQWDDGNTDFMIAILQATREKANYDNILKYIQNALSVPWKLNYNNQIFNLVATLHNHVVYYETIILPNENISTMTQKLDTPGHTLETLKSNLHFIMLNKHLSEFRKDMISNSKKVMITKMSFCILIELETPEYTEYFDEITLTESNKKLVTGEYIKVVGQNGEVRVRICLEDLYPPQSVASRSENHDYLRLALAMMYMYLYV